MLLHPTIFRESFKTEAVTLALMSDEMRMRGSEHEIDHIRMLPDDFRQCFDHMLDAFARPEQTKGEQHLAAFDAELLLVAA